MSCAQTCIELPTVIDTETDSVVEETHYTASVKRMHPTPPEMRKSRNNKTKEVHPTPTNNEEVLEHSDDGNKNNWEIVLSRKTRQKQRKEQQLKQQPKQKKQVRSTNKPNALIIRPTEKAKYAEILDRVKKGIPDEQVRSTVNKIQMTVTGDLLIILSKKNTDGGLQLKKNITDLLKNDATVISKEPQEKLEIRDLDILAKKKDIVLALQTAAGEEYQIQQDTIISLRKAYRGTQTALVTVAVPIAKKILDEHEKIRIGWNNCRIRSVKSPTKCYKCWQYGHLATQCKSGVDRTHLCMKCGKGGHKVAECSKEAQCVLCIEKGNLETCAHIAGTSRCPVYKEALQKVEVRRL
uniref:Uncharacterized protein LOC114328183 n=1 Tax=Diabrotica virgifera virgifera TaxID=50390 RepID=A0A6P7FI61_DIAVI